MKLFRLIAVAVACLFSASPALAGGDDSSSETFQPIDAQAMIDACWKTNEELFLNAYTIREGTLRSALCLEDRIVEQLEALVAPEYLTREEAAHELRAIRMAYGSLIWKIHNEHRRCSFRTCGLYDQSLHVSAVAEFMETLLQEVAKQRNRFEF